MVFKQAGSRRTAACLEVAERHQQELESYASMQWAGKVMATFKMQRVPSGSLLTRMSQAA